MSNKQNLKEFIQLLISKEINVHDKNFLIDLIKTNEIELIKKVYEHGLERDLHPTSIFSAAIDNDNVEILSFLLEKKIDMEDAQLLLTRAINKGNIEIISLFIKKDIKIYDSSALDLAAYKNRIEVLKYLQNYTPNLQQALNSALVSASNGNAFETFTYLVENGADIQVENNYIFKDAIRKGNLRFLKYLIGKNINIHLDNDYAINTAASGNAIEMLKILVNNGANIYNNGNKPILVSAMKGFNEIVKYLYELYDDKKQINEIIKKNGNEDINKWLQSIELSNKLKVELINEKKQKIKSKI